MKTIEKALASIGYDQADIPDYRIDDGRIVIAIADNDDSEAEDTLATLRRNLPSWATAEWTGNSDTSGDGDTTSDCEIRWHPAVNAILIDAAPDLLAALEALLDEADLGEVCEETRPIIEQAQRAISKARGEA